MNAIASPAPAGLFELGLRLRDEGRTGDALAIFNHLSDLAPSDPQILHAQLHALKAEGRALEALQRLAAVKASLNAEYLLGELQHHSDEALGRFNAHLQAGETEQAEPYAAALAELAPGNAEVLNAAMSCNLALGRGAQAARYAQALLELSPEVIPARQVMAEVCKITGDMDGEIAHRMALALNPRNEMMPLVRLRDLHDVASLILRRPLGDRSLGQLEAVLVAARHLTVPVEPDTEFAVWERHYRTLMNGVDLQAVLAPTPAAPADEDLEFATGDGHPLTREGVRARADQLGGQAVFFAAGDEAYVELYARWFVLSVLKYADVPSLVVVHVIGGAGRLAEIAGKVGVTDPRVVFSACAFDAEAAMAVRCWESPPKGLMTKPVAHYQSVRFQRLGGLLALLERPIFVSDIDLLLQRGVSDLLARCAADDVVLNENEASAAAGSRITANLLMVRPTAEAQVMLGFLRAFLGRALAGAEVTRWIDQLGLILARHHLWIHAPQARIGYFDTSSDINNVMYPSYQEHPFRFLSLFHGFDTSSLEDPRVLGEAGVAPLQ